jgi:hypothetical protein
MATTNLIETGYGDLSLQHGNGTPNHTAAKGSLYTDRDTATLYQNSNGATTWGAVGEEGIATDMAALVVERTTNLALSGTATEITFDTTTTENDTAVLEHNNTNNERIEIKTSGLHQIALSVNCDNISNSLETLELELRIDGVAVQTLDLEISKTSEELVTRITAVELTAGTYLTFAAYQLGGGTDLTLKAKTVAYVLKLQGTKGGKGDTGAGSNIIVQDEGVTQGTVIDTIDFVGGGVNVTELGGKATVTIVSASWQPNSVPLLAVAASGASLFANDGAGVYYSFAGTADDAIFFNDTLSKSNTSYDGSDLKMRLFCRLNSNGGVGDKVGLLVDYAIIKPGDNSSTIVTNIAQQDVDVSSEVQDEMFTIDLGTMTGVVGGEILMFTLTRNGTGTGADTYSGNFELLGMELIIV